MPGISEIPNIRFSQGDNYVSEAEGTLEVCVVAGLLLAELTPVNVTISTAASAEANAATGTSN